MGSLLPPADLPVTRHALHQAPPQHRSSSRSSSAHRTPRRSAAPNNQSAPTAASPEVISSLVDQLTRLSPSPLENPALYGSLAPADDGQSFPARGGVHDTEYEYTARDGSHLHPDDAALPPVVRTSKPPSGYSPYTAGDSANHSRRSSGISIGKGGVDIPSYVRNYMNRAAVLDGAPERPSRDSSLSGSSGSRRPRERESSRGRLSKPPSDERVRVGSGKSRERSVGRERDTGEEEYEEAEEEEEVRDMVPGSPDHSRAIPNRRSSWGKGSSPGHNVVYQAYRPPTMTTETPLHTSPPAGSPLMPPAEVIAEDDSEDGAAPPPALNRSRTEKKVKKEKRGSKAFPKRSDSLPLGAPKSPRSPKQRQNRFASTPSTPRTKNRHSEPQGLLFAHPQSPPRPSFASAPEARPPLETIPPRPSSGDSIDDAVESYMSSPRLSQKIRMPGSTRTISFSEVGDPNGFAVFVCVGMGLTRFITAFYDELALTLGLRLITPDRPGVGESDAIDEHERTVLSWPDDVLFICQSLRITKFSILAHSAGAIYALATALRMPGHIRGKIHLLAPWIPPSQMEMTNTATNGADAGGKAAFVPTSQRILRALPTPILRAANSSFIGATSASLTTSLPRTKASKRRAADRRERAAAMALPPAASTPGPDGEPLTPLEPPPLSPADVAAMEKERQGDYDERLTTAIWVLSTRNANPAVDLLVCLERMRPVGFRYVDITREVVVTHGAKDTRVPVANVEWLGRAMRRCEVRVLREEGHGLMASARVMGEVLEEIAGEWRDWKKVVEGRDMDDGTKERTWVD